MVREAVFNALGSLDVVQGARVFDLFAGTGAMGMGNMAQMMPMMMMMLAATVATRPLIVESVFLGAAVLPLLRQMMM